MKKRLFALLLTLALFLGAAPPARAQENFTFPRVKSYSGQFWDVPMDSPFYWNIASLYEHGLSVGMPDGSFGVQDSLTVGQVYIFAGRIRSIFRYGHPEAGAAQFQSPGRPLALSYLLYLQAEGVADHELEPLLSLPASRAEVAHILAHVLTRDQAPPLYLDAVQEGYATRQLLPDVNEYTTYYQDILWLYACGISQGIDAVGSFCPEATITRGAVSAMLTRIIDPALRLEPDWAFQHQETWTMADLIVPGPWTDAPYNPEEMDGCIRCMLSEGEDTLSLQYDYLDAYQADLVMGLALQAIDHYAEQSYYSASAQYWPDGRMEIFFYFSKELRGEALRRLRNETMEAALSVRDSLYEDGFLWESMSDYEKAFVYYQWIAYNCCYDSGVYRDSVSHLGWSVFHRGTAVCDGYTAAYNLLLKLEGIPCLSICNDTHMWSLVFLDGVEYHVDVTWGDQENRVDRRYFAMTEAESWAAHPW